MSELAIDRRRFIAAASGLLLPAALGPRVKVFDFGRGLVRRDQPRYLRTVLDLGDDARGMPLMKFVPQFGYVRAGGDVEWRDVDPDTLGRTRMADGLPFTVRDAVRGGEVYVESGGVGRILTYTPNGIARFPEG